MNNMNHLIEKVKKKFGFNREKRRFLSRFVRRHDLPEEFMCDVFGYMHKYKGKIWDVMALFMSLSRWQGDNIVIFRKRIGDIVGLEVKQISRITERLSKLGFIAKETLMYALGNGEYRNKVIYSVHPYLKKKGILKYLFPFFSSLLEKKKKQESSSESTDCPPCPTLISKDIYLSSLNVEMSKNGESTRDKMSQSGSKKVSKESFKKMSQKLAGVVRPSWDNDRAETINPQEELKKAYVKMPEEALRFMITLGGKEAECARLVLDYRKKNKKCYSI